MLQGTYPTCEQDWQREACFLLWLHDSQGGRLRACMPAVDALDVNLRPKTKLVKQLKELVGARVAELASKLDVMGMWQQLQQPVVVSNLPPRQKCTLLQTNHTP